MSAALVPANEGWFARGVDSADAEMMTLAAVLYKNEALEQCGVALTEEHFSEPLLGWLWARMLEILRRDEIADAITLHNVAQAYGSAYEDCGGLAFLGDLIDKAPEPDAVAGYARVVYDAHARRTLVRLCQETAQAGLRDRERPAFEMIAELRQALERAEADAAPEDATMIAAPAAAARAVATMQHLAQHGRGRGCMTGLRCIDRRLNGLKPGAMVVIGGRPGMGKAQPLDAKVLLADGRWRVMGDLAVGDELASVDGAPSSVTGLFPQGEKQVYRVTFSDGRSTECCGEHLWSVRFRDWPAARVLSTDDLRVMLTRKRYSGRLWIDLASGDFGADADLPVDPWVLGALIGDGALKKSTPRFSTADTELLERLQSRLGPEFQTRFESQYDHRIVRASGNRRAGHKGVLPNTLGVSLHGLGLGVRSEEKFLPPVYLAACRETRVELLRGLMDTDGWAESFNVARFATSSPRLANDVATLVRSLGGVAKVGSGSASYTHKGERRTGLPTYRITVSGLAPDEVFSLARKRSRLTPRAGTRRLTISAIEPARTAPTQCISVSHASRLYVTDDYIVTHNTGLARAIAHGAAIRNPQQLFLFLGIEMSPDEMMNRELSAITHELGDGIEHRAMDSGALTPMDFMKIAEAQGRVPHNLILDDCASLALEDVRRKVWALRRQGKVGAVFIDYLQIMRRPQARGRNDATVLAEMTAGLKLIARQAQTTVVLLSQLNRAVEQRDDKRPQLSDLRESGSIEQDADAVLFPYREFYYVSRAEPKAGGEARIQWEMQCEDLRRRLDVICAKQRGGPEGADRQRYFAEFDFIEDGEDR